MQRHELEPISLFAGLVFVLVAGSYGLTHSGNVDLHWIAALPVGLIVVGATILAVVVRRMRPAVCDDPSSDVQ